MTLAGATGATRGTSLATGVFNEILKEVYRPAIVDLLNSKTVLARLLGNTGEGIEGGKYHVGGVRTGRNYGYGYAGEGGRLPDPHHQTNKQYRYEMRYSYGRIKFTGPAASASRSDRGSFVRIMDQEVNGMAQDIQHNDNRIMFGDGSGRLCEINLASTGLGAGPWPVVNPGGIVSTGLGTQYLAPGMRVSVVANDTAAIPVGTQPTASFAGGFRAGVISAVDYSGGTVTFTSVLTKAAAQHMYLHIGNELSTDLTGLSFGRGLEPNGLAAIVDDADPVFQDATSWDAGLGAIDVATFPIWSANIIDNGGVAIPFAPDMFQQGMDLADIASDSMPDMWVTTHGIRRQYLNSLVAAKRYPNTMKLDGGFSALTYDGRPIVVDKDCTRGRIYGLALEAVYKAYETDYDWMDQDGSILTRMADEDAFGACMYRYWNLCTDARNRHVLIADILDI